MVIAGHLRGRRLLRLGMATAAYRGHGDIAGGIGQVHHLQKLLDTHPHLIKLNNSNTCSALRAYLSGSGMRMARYVRVPEEAVGTRCACMCAGSDNRSVLRVISISANGQRHTQRQAEEEALTGIEIPGRGERRESFQNYYHHKS